MHAKTNLQDRLPSWHVAEGRARAPRRFPCHAEIAEVFKKTPDIADLNPAGRYVVTDLVETVTIPHLMKALSDRAVRAVSKPMFENSAVTHPGGKAEKVSYADQ